MTSFNFYCFIFLFSKPVLLGCRRWLNVSVFYFHVCVNLWIFFGNWVKTFLILLRRMNYSGIRIMFCLVILFSLVFHVKVELLSFHLLRWYGLAGFQVQDVAWNMANIVLIQFTYAYAREFWEVNFLTNSLMFFHTARRITLQLFHFADRCL